MTKYYLAIERRHKDFFPINDLVMENSSSESLYSIENIDKFTENFDDEIHLKNYLLSINVINLEDFDSAISIYFSDTKTRKLFDGVCYKDDAKYLEVDYLKEILLQNKKNHNFLNNIVQTFSNNKGGRNQTWGCCLFLKFLPKIDDNPEALMILSCLPYDELRAIGLFIKKEMIKEAKINDKSRVLIKNNININE